jgi:glycosyltransferase involved in cell wall biosynthesis
VADLYPEVAEALNVLPKSGPIHQAFHAIRDHGIRRADRVVVLGRLMGNKIRDLGVDPSRIEIVQNWADGDEIKPISRLDNWVRTDWELGSNLVVGYSGNLGRAHEFDTMLGAAQRLRDDGVSFLFIGNGPRKPEVEAAKRDRALSNVILKDLQPRENIPFSLTAPDVHILSLRPEMEGLMVPGKFYGAIATGRPIIFVGAPWGELSRIIRENKLGFSIEIGDVEGLTRVLQSLRDDEDQRTQLGENARRFFETHHSASKTLSQWSAVFHQLEGMNAESPRPHTSIGRQEEELGENL